MGCRTSTFLSSSTSTWWGDTGDSRQECTGRSTNLPATKSRYVLPELAHWSWRCFHGFGSIIPFPVPCVFPGRRHHQRGCDVPRCHPCTCHDLPENQQQVLTWECLEFKLPCFGCAEVWNCWDVTWNPFSFAMPCRSIADWLKAPDTMYLLDFVKPEFLLLRVRFSLASFLCLFK